MPFLVSLSSSSLSLLPCAVRLALGMRGRGVRPPFHGMGVIHGGCGEVSGQIEGHSSAQDLSTLPTGV